ncbi:MAG: YfcE family phosphodiesterase [Pseudomonadota bacterium]
MKVGILSDSHGSLKNLEDAAKWLVENENVTTLVHLGDECEDTEILGQFKVRIIQVPGVFCSHYRDPAIPNRLIKNFAGNKVLISHTESSHKNDLPGDLKPEEVIDKNEVDMVWVGHTHILKIEESKGILILNPGHLQSNDKKGYLPSFGLVDFEAKVAKIISLEGKATIIQKNW